MCGAIFCFFSFWAVSWDITFKLCTHAIKTTRNIITKFEVNSIIIKKVVKNAIFFKVHRLGPSALLSWMKLQTSSNLISNLWCLLYTIRVNLFKFIYFYKLCLVWEKKLSRIFFNLCINISVTHSQQIFTTTKVVLLCRLNLCALVCQISFTYLI